MTTPARVRAQTKWESKAYEKILVRIKTDQNGNRGPDEVTRQQIQAAADRAGESINAYILEAVRERMQKDGEI